MSVRVTTTGVYRELRQNTIHCHFELVEKLDSEKTKTQSVILNLFQNPIKIIDVNKMNNELVLKFLEDNGFDRQKLDIIKDERGMLLSLVKAVSWEKQLEFLEELYVENFIPEAGKVDIESKQELEKIKREYGLSIQNSSLASDETIRFGYIALYHKIENSRKELMRTMLPIFNIEEKEFLNSFKANFNIDFHKPKEGIIYKFSWIADCTKHQNAIASERAKPPIEFENYPRGKQISIDKSTFLKDSKNLRNTFKELCLKAAIVCVIKELTEL